MAQYIDKSAVVAEIKERIETYNKGYANGDDRKADALEVLLHDIDTLEVKEVNLEEEIKKYIKDNICGYCVPGVEETAKYFFELGLKAKEK